MWCQKGSVSYLPKWKMNSYFSSFMCCQNLHYFAESSKWESETDSNILQGHKPQAAMRLPKVSSKFRNKISNSLITSQDFVVTQVSRAIKWQIMSRKEVLVWKGYCIEKDQAPAILIHTVRLWWLNTQNKETNVKWQ